MINAEIDWGTFTPNALQFALSGNSPVALSQIVAMSVDNSRCGSDVQMIFPDSGFVLDVPAHCAGVYPVFTNALTFYAVAANSTVGDVTILQILNSLPPPIPIQLSAAQQIAAAGDIPLTNGTTQIIPATVSGTVTSIQLGFNPGSSGTAAVQLIDGTGRVLWQNQLTGTAAGPTIPMLIAPVSLRFYQGVRMVVTLSTLTASGLNVSIYYTVP